MEPIQLTDIEIDRIVEMAWEDRTPFFIRWRKRVQSRSTKHKRLRNKEVIRFKCSRQKTITNNKISKRS